jgi:hypothetical protein
MSRTVDQSTARDAQSDESLLDADIDVELKERSLHHYRMLFEFIERVRALSPRGVWEHVPPRYLPQWGDEFRRLPKGFRELQWTAGDAQSEESPTVDQGFVPRPTALRANWLPDQFFFGIGPGVERAPEGVANIGEQQIANSPAVALAKIADERASHEARRMAVIDAEVIAFPPDKVVELDNLLRRFIEQNRNSDDPQDLIAVASAIRKYVATMDRDDLSAIVRLLGPGHNTPVPLEIELEVAKTLARRLTVDPPDDEDSEPELADWLNEIARTFLNARLLPLEKIGAVTLNAVLALLLLRSRHVKEVLQILNGLSAPWFTDLVRQRVSQIRNRLASRFPKPQAEHYTRFLSLAEEELSSVEP